MRTNSILHLLVYDCMHLLHSLNYFLFIFWGSLRKHLNAIIENLLRKLGKVRYQNCKITYWGNRYLMNIKPRGHDGTRIARNRWIRRRREGPFGQLKRSVRREEASDWFVCWARIAQPVKPENEAPWSHPIRRRRRIRFSGEEEQGEAGGEKEKEREWEGLLFL